MSNRLTRVPERPVPTLPRWARAVLPVADVFMILMVSRPRTGSLRQTWVTPATLQLCAAVALAAGLCGAFLLATGALWTHNAAVAMGAGLLVLAAGSAAVAAVGLAQRRA